MNPLFPLDEYVPDGEPHVFGDRVYLYGSHDEVNGQRFCTRDYVVYSAPIDNLNKWTCHGVAYKKEQDPRSKEGKLVDFYAPDCVKGNDGRYYLYYFAAGPNTTPFGPMSVAVSSAPEGPFEYLGDIRNQDGSPLLDYLTNDPAVINDGGRIFLYYGWGLGRDFRSKLLKPLYDFVLSKLCKRSLKNIRSAKPSVLSCACVELESDMLTAKKKPVAVLDSLTTAKKGSPLYDHPFYEAPSIRKFGDVYYLFYSSGKNNELAYATSKFPDRGFAYQGVAISNSDLGYLGNKQRKAPAGTIHGSVEFIAGQYYVFYHRCTNNTDFSRQACAEKIKFKNGKFLQAELTSQGVGEALKAEGEWSAAYCCNLYNAGTSNVQGNGHEDDQPNIAYKDGDHYLRAIREGTRVVFKHFSFVSPSSLTLSLRGDPCGVEILAGSDEPFASLRFEGSASWASLSTKLPDVRGIKTLTFFFHSEGKIDFKSFKFE